MEIKNLNYHEDRWLDGNWTKEELIGFEDDIIKHWENGEIKGPIHLSNGNEEPLIEVFKKISPSDWVFSTWRSHYHALLHGVEPSKLKQKILDVTLEFYICKYQNKNFVFRTIPITLERLVREDRVFIPHEFNIESDSTEVSIVTKKFFDTYSLRTLNESKV